MVLGLGIFVVQNNSRTRDDYQKSSGTIEYLALEFQHLPVRHKGDYRYLKIDSYPYMFEIYEPNSEPDDRTIDNLETGDEIDIYYYETGHTHESGLNRYTQFIYHHGQSYFVRNGFQEQLGYIVIGLSLLINVMAFAFWKQGRLDW